MIVKLNMIKAYHQFSWKFFDRVLERLGFCSRWRRWVSSCYKGLRFSIITNNSSAGFCRSSRGLRIPMSPYLFNIMAKTLGRRISPAIEGITRQQFMDDTILMGKPTIKEAKEFRRILNLYEKVPYQMINMDKNIVFFINMEEIRQRGIGM